MALPKGDSAPLAPSALREDKSVAPIRSLSHVSILNSFDENRIPAPAVESQSSWLLDLSVPRASSPELETDISRTSSTSTKHSLTDSMDSNQSVHTAHSGDNVSEPPPVPSKTDSPPDHPEFGSRVRSQVKRLHALLELVETEANYVKDLDVLVYVFFKLLPTVPYLAEDAARLSTVIRNGPQLLELHRDLDARLQNIVQKQRLNDASLSELARAQSPGHQEAVALFAEAFIDFAPRFQVYCEFCSKHKEALELIDAVEHRPEWDAYQMRASDAVGSRDAVSRKRLQFRDFFIKPIQRVCLYPILMQTIQRYSAADAAVRLGEAMACMRRITSDVNAASAERHARLLSDMIVSRMEPSLELSSSFLPSLGNCRMTGNLGVLYHHSTWAPLTWPLTTKYYGCVLYSDFVMMFKVRKTHTYEPRYWFPLAEAKLKRSDERSVRLPHLFRISVRGHHFELMASTAKEHNLWLDAFSKAMADGPSPMRRVHGMDVPFPCNLADKGPAAPATTDQDDDPLARYLDDVGDAAPSLRGQVLVRHKSPPRRAAMDRGMVFSDACISARSSIDGHDWAARSHSSRVGLHRLSGSETVSLRISPSSATDAPPTTRLMHADSTESLLGPRRTDVSQRRLSVSSSPGGPPASSSPAGLLPRSQSMIGRTLQGWLTPSATQLPIKAEELSMALLEACTPEPAAPTRLRRGRCSSMDMRAEAAPTRTIMRRRSSTSMSRRSDTSAPQSPHRRLTQRFLQRHRLSTMDV
ncbi:hypothetical protein MARU1_000889 [Malassezia arunalokei]|uniref:DH domain-containing protein n=1 Tax=Malassezia arunalokei TaxID=1514897 RepID=A0AAJ5YYK8_9BASI|nr:hypothetical protein MARU1_000889 [Malassezia arunalokei]